MDPLSVAASVAGLLMAGAQISSTLQNFISAPSSAPSFAQNIRDELHDFGVVLSHLQLFLLGSVSPSHSGASVIDVDQLKITLTGCVFTFSELEKEVYNLGARDNARMGVRDRFRWAWSEPTIVQLIQRIQNHKLSLTLMLTILRGGQSDEATNSVNRLCTVVEQLVESNTQMSNRLRMLESGLAVRRPSSANDSISIASFHSGVSYRLPLATDISSSSSSTASIRTVTSFTLFDAVLFKTRVYRTALRHVAKSVIPESKPPTARWSVLSGISLAEVSNISVLSLPVWAGELFNPQWYSVSAVDASPRAVDTPPGELASAPNSDCLLHDPIPGSEDTVTDVSCQSFNTEDGQLDSILNPSGRMIDPTATHLDTSTTDVSSSNSDTGSSPLIATSGEPRPTRSNVTVLTRGLVTIDLCTAAAAGEVVAVLELLRRGADKEEKDYHGYGPLQLAAKYGRDEVVRLLLSKGALIGAQTRDGNTALHLAAMSGRESTVRLLLSREAERDPKNAFQHTPLHLAAMHGQYNIVDVLLKSGALVGALADSGYTPIHFAAVRGKEMIVRLLLEQGADKEARTDSGKTPIHFAAGAGKHANVKLLLDYGADIEAMTMGIEQLTPLHLAATRGSVETVLLLLHRGACKEARNTDGDTPIHLAAAEGHQTTVETLIEHGADKEASAKDGMTPLHRATARGQLATVRLLLQLGASKQARTTYGNTLLHIAAAEGYRAVVELLLEQGADKEARTSDGRTPLHRAAARGQLGIVQLLLQQGANTEANTNNGKTPLSLAMEHRKWEMVEYLSGYNADMEAVKESLEAVKEGGIIAQML